MCRRISGEEACKVITALNDNKRRNSLIDGWQKDAVHFLFWNCEPAKGGKGVSNGARYERSSGDHRRKESVIFRSRHGVCTMTGTHRLSSSLCG